MPWCSAAARRSRCRPPETDASGPNGPDLRQPGPLARAVAVSGVASLPVFALLDFANDWIKTGGWIALAAIVFAESGLLIGFFLPGDSLLFFAGFLASDAASYNCNNKKSSSSKKQKLAEAAAPPTTPPAPTTAPSAVPTSTTASTTTATAPTATFWTFFTTDSMTVPTRILNLKMIFI